jgi:hypothetical protein
LASPRHCDARGIIGNLAGCTQEEEGGGGDAAMRNGNDGPGAMRYFLEEYDAAFLWPGSSVNRTTPGRAMKTCPSVAIGSVQDTAFPTTYADPRHFPHHGGLRMQTPTVFTPSDEGQRSARERRGDVPSAPRIR